ncbi:MULTISPECIES: DUF1460 domain-containing protein [unclassified Pantoea]|uniref:DUF1460 domain-containing protein n=1 Tax=Pantoea sp. Ap-959 TaxID=2608359 RepID=UPI001E4E7B72|nr:MULTISPECIES: DUF1460 domain-containing protein [unclassified Pantoea]
MLLLTSLCLSACSPHHNQSYRVIMNSAAAEKVNEIIKADVITSKSSDHGTVISRVSSDFLNTPYQSQTLVGGPDTPEALVVNLRGMDCFTLADYVEALSRSHDHKSFLYNLRNVRYADGNVDYLSRRHFFSDWFAIKPYNARDITPEISANYMTSEKMLNRRPDGGEFVSGLGIHPREINYIPGRAINQQVLDRLRNGDYVGIYSTLEGLDVTHVGIVIRYNGQVWLRNASSLAINRRVVDSPFLEYTRLKPGIVVLRAE